MDYEKRRKRKIHPKDRCNILSNIFFIYTLGLFKKSFKNKDFGESDLYEVPQNLESKLLSDHFEKQWLKQKSRKKSSIFRLILSCFGKRYLLLGIFQLSMDVTETIIYPYALGKFVSYFTMGQNDITIYDASFYAFILISFSFCQRVYKTNFTLLILGLGIKIRLVLSSLVQRKILKVNTTFLDDFSIGKIITMYTKDADGFEVSVDFGNDLWIGLIKIIVVSFILYKRIGIAAVAGISTFFISIPLQIYLGSKFRSLKTKMFQKTDRRLQLMQETLSAIKIVKSYVWEKVFIEKISSARKKEVNAVYKVWILKHIILLIAKLNSYLAFYILMMTYISFGNNVTAETVYFVSATFETLSYGLSVLFPNAVVQTAEFISALQRAEGVLEAEELQTTEKLNSLRSPKITLNDVNLTLQNKPVLQNVKLTIEKGLTIITGPVGSGKSTLLKVILQEYKVNENNIVIEGDISYASQEPWLFPSTIRQNILFGEKYDETRYQEVLRVCCLIYDLQLLKAGDNTIVEDRAINLSKGQQVRINLARAVYRNSDIYLLDDSLAALDSHVSVYIFEECIKKFLQNKIVVLTTHNAYFIKDADNVIILSDGFIQEINQTPHPDKNKSSIDIEKPKMHNFNNHEKEEETDETSKLITNGNVVKRVYQEKKQLGNVDKKVYIQYFNFAGGFFAVTMIFTVYAIAQFSSRYTDKLVSNWVNVEERILNYTTNSTDIKANAQYEELNEQRVQIFYYYITMTIVTCLTSFGQVLVLFFFTRRASLRLHNKSMSIIINAAMKFFDENFIGNVLNRFSKDLMEVDEFTPLTLNHTLDMLFNVVGTIMLIASVNPAFLVSSAIFCVTLIIIAKFCFPTVRDLKRLESLSRSPFIGHINATVEGLPTIRASKAQTILRDEFNGHLNFFTSANYTFYCTLQTFVFLVDVMSVLFIGFIIIRILFSSDEILSGDVGMAITQTVMMTKTLRGGIRTLIETDNRMAMAERILEYTEAKQERRNGMELSDWPKQYCVRFQDVNLRYDTSKDFTLSNINFTVGPKENMGIVGRTGAGKSSIISSLFRLYNFQGIITIDDVDINTLSLDFLRSKISIIPQDPVLFTGSIRENIDPMKLYTDEEIWNVIEITHLKKHIPSLELRICNDGSNFSSGQKQLICLARALVKNNKIIILDEATATLDPETDNLINTIIKQNFALCTVITIAHKLHTVLSCHKVVVLDQGRIVEYDKPSILLQNENSTFYKMVTKSGLC